MTTWAAILEDTSGSVLAISNRYPIEDCEIRLHGLTLKLAYYTEGTPNCILDLIYIRSAVEQAPVIALPKAIDL